MQIFMLFCFNEEFLILCTPINCVISKLVVSDEVIHIIGSLYRNDFTPYLKASIFGIESK